MSGFYSRENIGFDSLAIAYGYAISPIAVSPDASEDIPALNDGLEFGERLNQLKEWHDLSFRNLSAELGRACVDKRKGSVTAGYLQRIVLPSSRSDRRTPSREVIEGLSAVFGVSENWLRTGNEQ